MNLKCKYGWEFKQTHSLALAVQGRMGGGGGAKDHEREARCSLRPGSRARFKMAQEALEF